MTTKTAAKTNVRKNVRGQQDGPGSSKRSSEINHDEIRRAAKAHKRVGRGYAKSRASKAQTSDQLVIAMATKALKAYDATQFIANRANGDQQVTSLTTGSPAQQVAVKMIELYGSIETVTGTHRARVNLLKGEFARRYVAPKLAHQLGLKRAIGALEAASQFAETVRRLDLQKAKNSVLAIEILLNIQPSSLTGQLIDELLAV